MTEQAEAFRESVKTRYGFAGWDQVRAAVSTAPRRGFSPRQDALEPFVLSSRRALPDHRNAYIDFYRRAGDPTVLFSVTVIEHATPREAHEGLIDFLTTVMAPTLPAAAERDVHVGGVGFAGHADLPTDVAFVVVTVFVRVQSIGETEASVKELAELLARHVQEHFA